MRILHFITGLGVGGAERYLHKILPHLEGSTKNVVCSMTGEGPMAERIRELGIPVYCLHISASPISLIKGVGAYRRLIKEHTFDVQINYLIHADLFGRFFGRLFGIKTIISSQRGALLNWEFLRRFDRMSKGLVDHYFVQTEVAKKEISSILKANPENFTVIPNVIEEEVKTSSPSRSDHLKIYEINSHHTVIICVSNLRKGKGHSELIKAFEIVHAHTPTTALLIVGKGEEYEMLTQLAQSTSAKDAIHFAGEVAGVSNLLRACDIFVLATHAEGMSNAILEAMQAGLPCVVTNIPVNAEVIVHEKTGLLFELGSSEDIAKQLIKTVESKSLREKLGSAAKQFVEEQFNPKTISAKILNTVSAIVNRKSN